MSKKILVISPVPSHPQNAGNRARIYNLLLSLKAAGHEVYFAYVEETPGDKAAMRQCWGDQFFSIPYTKPKTAHRKRPKHLAAKLWVKLQAVLGNDPRYTYAIDDWYDERIDASIADISKKVQPEVVIAEYVFFSKALEAFDSSVLKIIDTHDVFTNRYKLYLKNKQKPRWFSTTKQEEKKGLRRADVAIAIQSKEASFLSQLLQAHQRVVTIGHLATLQPISSHAENHSILYIGSRNRINVSGVQFFIREVLPKVRATLDDVQLIMAGEICDVVEDFDGCRKLGRIDTLADAYGLANVTINPVHFGTGLKIKSIEALGYSKPLVTTSIGAEGLEDGAGKAFIVADTPDDFARSIIEILSDKQRREALAKQAYCFAKQRNLQCLESLTNLLEQRG